MIQLLPGENMKTDLDIIRDMLARAGIEGKERYEESACCEQSSSPRKKMVSLEGGIRIEVSDLGYAGFSTEFMFDRDGNLMAIGSWE